MKYFKQTIAVKYSCFPPTINDNKWLLSVRGVDSQWEVTSLHFRSLNLILKENKHSFCTWSVIPATNELTTWTDANFMNRRLFVSQQKVKQTLLTRIMNMTTWTLWGQKFLLNKHFLFLSLSLLSCVSAYIPICLSFYITICPSLYQSILCLSTLSTYLPSI